MYPYLFEELCRCIYIPLPTEPLEPISADCPPEDVAKRLDAFFDDITKGYPKDTRDWLLMMYHDEPYVCPTAQLSEKNPFCGMARWSGRRSSSQRTQDIYRTYLSSLPDRKKVLENSRNCRSCRAGARAYCTNRSLVFSYDRVTNERFPFLCGTKRCPARKNADRCVAGANYRRRSEKRRNGYESCGRVPQKLYME